MSAVQWGRVAVMGERVKTRAGARRDAHLRLRQWLQSAEGVPRRAPVWTGQLSRQRRGTLQPKGAMAAATGVGQALAVLKVGHAGA